MLDAVRLEPGDGVTTVQIREVVERLVAVAQRQEGDPDVLVVMDAGYDASRIRWQGYLSRSSAGSVRIA